MFWGTLDMERTVGNTETAAERDAARGARHGIPIQRVCNKPMVMGPGMGGGHLPMLSSCNGSRTGFSSALHAEKGIFTGSRHSSCLGIELP